MRKKNSWVQRLKSLVPKTFRSDHPQKVHEFLTESKGRPLTPGLELRGERKDGTVFPVGVSPSPVKTEQELLISCTVPGISEHKKEKQKLQAILESAPDTMVVVNEHHEIIIDNSQVERSFGYERIDQPIEILVPARFRAGHPEKFNDFAHAPVLRPMESGLKLLDSIRMVQSFRLRSV